MSTEMGKLVETRRKASEVVAHYRQTGIASYTFGMNI